MIGRARALAFLGSAALHVGAVVAVLALATTASAQTASLGTSTGQNPSTQTSSSSTPDTTGDTRPATTTFYGDTGLWFVPTAEVLAHDGSAALQRETTPHEDGCSWGLRPQSPPTP